MEEVRVDRSVWSLRALVSVWAEIWIYSRRREERPMPPKCVEQSMSGLGNDLLVPLRPARPKTMRDVSTSMSSNKWISAMEKGVMQNE